MITYVPFFVNNTLIHNILNMINELIRIKFNQVVTEGKTTDMATTTTAIVTTTAIATTTAITTMATTIMATITDTVIDIVRLITTNVHPRTPSTFKRKTVRYII
jgi:hypothetical protein